VSAFVAWDWLSSEDHSKVFKMKRQVGDGLSNNEASNFFIQAEAVLHCYSYSAS
jgi:hypothetical protein